MTKGFTVPLKALGASSLLTASQFEASMSVVEATSGASATQMEKMSQSAIDMSREFGVRATEVAGAMNYLALSGMDATQVMQALPAVMNLATSAKMDFGTTAGIVTKALAGFGMEADEAGRVADVLATANKNANTSVAELGQALKYVGPIAGGLGYTIEETAVALGVMSNAGISGSQAGTTLRQALLRLQAPTVATEKWMSKLGISMFNSAGEAYPLDSVLGQLRSSLADVDEETRSVALGQMFGATAVSGMSAIVNASQYEWDQLTVAMNGAYGSAERYSQIMRDNLKGDLAVLRSTLEAVGITIGNKLIPIVRQLTQWKTRLAESFLNLSPATQTAIVGFGAVVASIGPTLVIISKLMKAWDRLREMQNKMVASKVGKLIPAIKAKMRANKTLNKQMTGSFVTWTKHKGAILDETKALKLNKIATQTSKGVQVKKNLSLQQQQAIRAKLLKSQYANITAEAKATVVSTKSGKAIAFTTKKMAGFEAVLIAKTTQLKLFGKSLVTNAVGGLMKLGKSLATSKAGMIAMKVVTKTLSFGLKALGFAFKLAAGPIGLLIAGAGLLVTGFRALINWGRRNNETFQELSSSSEDLANRTDDLIGSIEDSEKAFRNNRQAILDNRAENTRLINTVVELARQEELSAGQREMIRRRTLELNEALETSINLLDNEGNVIEENVRAMRERNRLNEYQARINLYLDEATQIQNDRLRVEQKLTDIAYKRTWIEREYEAGNITLRDRYDLINDLGRTYLELNSSLYAVNARYYEMEANINRTGSAIERLQPSAEQLAQSFEHLAIRQGESFEQIEDRWNRVYESVFTNNRQIFDSNQWLADETAKHMESLGYSLQRNRQGTEYWSNSVSGNTATVSGSMLNMETATRNAVQRMVDDLIERSRQALLFEENMDLVAHNTSESFAEHMRGMVGDNYVLLGELVNGSKDQLMAMYGEYLTISGRTQKGFIQALTPMQKEAIYLAKNTGSKSAKALWDEIQAFEEHGYSAGSGLASGIQRSEESVMDMANRLGYGAYLSVRNGLNYLDPLMIEQFHKNNPDIIAGGINPTAFASEELARKSYEAVKHGLNPLEPFLNDQFYRKFPDTISGAGARASSVAESYGQSIENPIRNTLSNIDPLMMNAFNNLFPSIITSGAGPVRNAVDEYGNAIVDPLEQDLNEIPVLASGVFGRDLPDAIVSTTPTVERAVKGVASASVNSIKSQFQMNSPSRVFTNIGRNLMTSLGAGISNNRQSVVNEMNRLQAPMFTAGQNAMNGLQRGLNSRAGAVQQTARNIANNVRRTIQSALNMSSPSRDLKKDGVNIIRGLENGLISQRQSLLSEAKKTAFMLQKAMLLDNSSFDNMQIKTSVQTNYAVDRNNEIKLLREQNEILRGILDKDQTIVMNEKVVGEVVAESVTLTQNRNSRQRTFRGGVMAY